MLSFATEELHHASTPCSLFVFICWWAPNHLPLELPRRRASRRLDRKAGQDWETWLLSSHTRPSSPASAFITVLFSSRCGAQRRRTPQAARPGRRGGSCRRLWELGTFLLQARLLSCCHLGPSASPALLPPPALAISSSFPCFPYLRCPLPLSGP